MGGFSRARCLQSNGFTVTGRKNGPPSSVALLVYTPIQPGIDSHRKSQLAAVRLVKQNHQKPNQNTYFLGGPRFLGPKQSRWRDVWSPWCINPDSNWSSCVAATSWRMRTSSSSCPKPCCPAGWLCSELRDLKKWDRVGYPLVMTNIAIENGHL